MKLPQRSFLFVVVSLLAACATANGPTGNRPKPNAAKPSSTNQVLAASPDAASTAVARPENPATPASQAPVASVKPEASATPSTPLLPLRLGLALPASLVGAAAQGRLVGSKQSGALVAPQGATLVALADGRILSNHAAGLLGNHGGGLISDHGGGLISDHGGGLVANNGGGLVANNGGGLVGQGAGFRLAQADAPASMNTGGSPTYLWLVLALIDQQDQLLQAFSVSEPKLGEWRRFGAEGSQLLPPPATAVDFGPAIASVDAGLRQQRYAGILTQEGGAARLRMLWLPQADSPLSEGRPIMDYAASGGVPVLRARFVPMLEENFGLADSAARFAYPTGALGTEVEADVGERYLPLASQGLVARAITDNAPPQSIRRKVLIEAQSKERAWAMAARGLLQRESPQLEQRRDFYAFGFASPGQADVGLAIYRQVSLTFGAQVEPFFWLNPGQESVLATASPPPGFFGPDGVATGTPSAALRALAPDLGPNPQAFVPLAPKPGEDPSQDPALRVAPFPAELLARPQSP